MAWARQVAGALAETAGNGTVVATFTVSVSGRITGCAIAKSSGDAGVDGRICAGIRSIQVSPAPDRPTSVRVPIRLHGE